MPSFSDIFNPNSGQFFNGAFSANSALVTFGGFAGLGLIVQNINHNYAQQISTLYEIGSPAVYYVQGRAAGQASIARVVGPTKLNLPLLRQLADVCRAGDNTLTFEGSSGCGRATGQAMRYKMQGVVLQAIGGSTDAQSAFINEQLSLKFAALDLQ